MSFSFDRSLCKTFRRFVLKTGLNYENLRDSADDLSYVGFPDKRFAMD